MRVVARSPARVAVIALIGLLTALATGFAGRSLKPAPGAGVVDVSADLAFGTDVATGTGMVLSRSGEILTNNHVIRGARAIRVVDPTSGRGYVATVLGYSVSNDVALLQLRRAGGMDPVSMGDSTSVEVGQWVTAFGNAGGVGGLPSSSTGKVTGVNRSILVSDGRGLVSRLSGLIRIDAVLEPGDSGGPLVNARGRVIGMDSAASLGFNFRTAREGYAIPIDRVLELVRQIEAKRSSETVHVGSTPFLGLRVAPSRSGTREHGVVVTGISRRFPADHAGIQVGDSIVAVDGKRVGSYVALTAALLRHSAGGTVVLGWIDVAGKRHSATLKTVAGPPQ